MPSRILFFATLLFAACVLLNCSSSKCSATTCTGCCDFTGACQSGTAVSECGTGGNSCVTCTSSQACNGGVCGGTQEDSGYVCNASTCATGCCQNNTCVTQPSNSACGVGGGACQACTAKQFCSSSGQCDTVDSGPPFACGSLPACNDTQVCCIDVDGGGITGTSCQNNCPNPQDTISCASSANCSASTPVCCGIEVLGPTETEPDGGTACQFGALGTSCQSAANCQTALAQACDDSTTIVLCTTGADCAAAGAGSYSDCCTAALGNSTLRFCMNGTYEFFLHATDCN